ncbi:hypothetical protein MMC08_000560 [Hypocenomyce scalaris]|nr:hypothetical protein [Hypocenomyce scalaris]
MDSDPTSPSEDIAALMGFSSFGPASKPKKRKYNPAVENAVTDASLTMQGKRQQQQQQQHHKDYRTSSRASGGNRLPLGKGRVMGKGGREKEEVGGADVRALGSGILDELAVTRGSAGDECAEVGANVKGADSVGMGEEENGGVDDDDAPTYLDTSTVPSVEDGRAAGMGNRNDEDDGPRYMDTSLPPPLDGLTAVPLPVAGLYTTVGGGAGPGEEVSGQQQQQQQHQELPAIHSTGSELQGGEIEAAMAPGGRRDWRALRRGVRNQRGDLAYYDESFVEDPWRELLLGR